MRIVSPPVVLLCMMVACICSQALGQTTGGAKVAAPGEARAAECSSDPDASCILAEAVELTQAIRLDYSRAWCLIKIAEVQVRGGKKREAREALAKAIDIAAAIETDGPSLLLWRVQEVLAEIGDIGAALAIVNRYKGGLNRALRLAVMARGQFKGGDKAGAHRTLERALDEARALKGEQDRDSGIIWSVIAEIAIDLGAKSQAQEALAEATDILSREAVGEPVVVAVYDLPYLAAMHAQFGNQREARELLARINGVLQRVKGEERDSALRALTRNVSNVPSFACTIIS